MNKINWKELENWLTDLNLDWGGKMIDEDMNYTSDYDMLVWELEKERIKINNIF